MTDPQAALTLAPMLDEITRPAEAANQKWRVGAEVLWVRSVGYPKQIQIRPVTISRLGRKWGYFQFDWIDARFDLEDGSIDDRNVHGTIYINQESYDRALARGTAKKEWEIAWDAFKKTFGSGWSYPDATRLAELRVMFDAAEAAMSRKELLS